MITDTLKKLRAGQTLDTPEMQGAIEDILNEGTTPSQIGAFLMGLSQRGETVDEIVGAAQFLRDRAETISSPTSAIDCCGTGGDNSHSLNISTAVAFVLAGCGVPVAKHGNRASSSKSGAADVLESLGINLNLTPAKCEEALRSIGFCFLMAPHHHKTLRPLAALRKELGFRTIFNLLGPLVNPANTSTQLIGVFDRSWVRPFAEVAQKLGLNSALIVHGSDGLDEITLTGPTYCAELKNNAITEYTLTPEDFGLSVIRTEDITGGEAAQNAAALMDLLNGKESAYRSIVLANAAAVLALQSDVALKDAVRKAAQSIDTGKAKAVFDSYLTFSRRCA